MGLLLYRWLDVEERLMLLAQLFLAVAQCFLAVAQRFLALPQALLHLTRHRPGVDIPFPGPALRLLDGPLSCLALPQPTLDGPLAFCAEPTLRASCRVCQGEDDTARTRSNQFGRRQLVVSYAQG